MNNLTSLQDITRDFAKQMADLEDSAVTQYLKSQISYLIAKGENLADYYLISENGNMTFDDGNSIKMATYYGLKHKSEVKVVEYQDDQLREETE